MTQLTSSALDGVRVIDFGQYIAGPMAAMMLGDFGADVIRIDPPGGPRYNTAANATFNRNKRSIALDLKNPADLDIARKLIAGADVVIENYRPGVMVRLGLGASAMTALNPRLIYCSTPGFPSDDPRAGMQAWEGVLGAATGCYLTHALLNMDRPVYNSLPFSSVYGAYHSAVAISMALNERARSGKGQVIEVPLFNATFTCFSGKAMKVQGAVEPEPGTTWRYALCKDGKWLLYVPRASHASLIKDFGIDAGLAQAELLRRIDELFLTRNSAEWEDYCAKIGAEGTACYTSEQWMEHPLARQSKIIEQFDDPELGRFWGPGLYTRLSETPGSVRSPRPRTDQHRQEILKELDAPKKPMPAATAEVLRGALQGVKVLDLGIILAVPSCGRTLSEFGADIIKIDSPHRNPVSWHNDVNRAKRSILVDFKTREGLDIFWKLLEDADVVIENFRTGVADKLGIGYEAVRKRKPNIIYASVNAYGLVGEFATRPGREVLVQGLTGMETRYGGAGHKPAQNPFNANDYATGLGVTLGIALALLHRQRTGKGQNINGALIYSATMVQASLMQSWPGKKWDEPGGLDCLGRGPLYRAYQASDGWLFIAAQASGLKNCPALADLAGQSGSALEKALEARLRERSVQDWEQTLATAGISAQAVVLDFHELMKDPRVIAQGLSLTRPHERLGMVTTTGPGIRLSRTPLVPGCPAPRPGADALSILGEIGMAGELDRLIQDGVVRTEGVEPGGAS
jgi:crotonobetainyl-CoA:carnitine CoA-transferase CaiB-like acyl-CoA transferase